MEENKEIGVCCRRFEKFWRIRSEYFLLFFIIVTISIIIYSQFIWGGKVYVFNDANDDTYQFFLPTYQSIVQKIQKKTFSFMDLSWGTGSNILSAQFVVFDPFAIILYVAGCIFGTEKVADALIWAQILRVICSGLGCLFFLRSFSLNKNGRLIASVAYAFCGYLIGDIGQHYVFATAPVLFVILLALVERAINNQKLLPYLSICLAIIGIWSVYFCYMMLIVIGIYIIFRFFYDEQVISFKKVLNWFFPLVTALFVGILLSSVILLPTIFQMLFVSDRLSYGRDLLSLFIPNSTNELKSMFLRFFSGHMEGTMNNWKGYASSFNVPHLYFSAFLPACFPQFVSGLQSESKKLRYIIYVAIILVGFSMLFPAAGTIFNAFTGYTARYVFVLLPFMAYVVAKTITKAKQEGQFSKPGALFTIIICVMALLLREKSDIHLINIGQFISAVAPLCALFGIWLIANQSRVDCKKKWILCKCGAIIFVFFALLFECRSDLYTGRNVIDRKWLNETYHNKAGKTIGNLQNLSQERVFRIERSLIGWDHSPTFNNSRTHRYCNVSAYNNLLDSSYKQFRSTFGNGRDKLTFSFYGYGSLGRPLDKIIADLWGIRYLFTNYPTSEKGWVKIEEFENEQQGRWYLFQNPDIRSMGVFFDSWYPEEILDSLPLIDRQSMLPYAVSLNQPASKTKNEIPENLKTMEIPFKEEENFTVDKGSSIDNGPEISLNTSIINQNNYRVWLTFDVSSEDPVILGTSVNSGFGYNTLYWANQDYYLVGNGQWQSFSVELPNDSISIRFFLKGDANEIPVQLKNIKIKYTDGKSYTTEGIEMFSPSLSNIFGSTSIEKQGILVMPISYEEGWKVYVDENPAKMLIANKGLCAVELTPGNHAIKFLYKTPALELGIILSSIGLILVGLQWYLLFVYKYRQLL